MEILLAILIALQVLLLFVLFNRKSGDGYLKQDITGLSKEVGDLKESLTDKLTDRLDRNQEAMVKSLQRQYAQSSKIISDVVQNLTELKESNKQVVNVTDELKTLQNILQNPKQRGVLGEYYLKSVLENVLPPERFAMQHKFKDGQVVDAVILLDKSKILPVDSKFSLENYNRFVEAKNKTEKAKHLKAFKLDLKNRIDETSKYIRPEENTLDHAFMFIPSEAIYYDLLVNKVGSSQVASQNLIEYAFRDKKVVIVSPTTFLAYLQTVLQGLRSLQIEERAKEIQKQVGNLGRHLNVYEDYMQRLGKSLTTTVSHYNNAHKELGKVDKDIGKIADKNPGVEPLLIEKPNEDE